MVREDGRQGLAVLLFDDMGLAWRCGQIAVFWEDGTISPLPEVFTVTHFDVLRDTTQKK
jgi:hypothetical protein